MTERDFRDYLDDIMEYARKAKGFIADVSIEEFFDDNKTQMAVAHAFVIIGEATKRIPEDFRRRHPDIPWREMAGMRDFLAHRYREVSPSVLFETAAHNIDVVIDRLPAIIAELDASD